MFTIPETLRLLADRHFVAPMGSGSVVRREVTAASGVIWLNILSGPGTGTIFFEQVSFYAKPVGA